MSNVLRRLWADDRGAVISTELVLVIAILIFGIIPGLVALRNSVIAAPALRPPSPASPRTTAPTHLPPGRNRPPSGVFLPGPDNTRSISLLAWAGHSRPSGCRPIGPGIDHMR